MTRKDQAEMDLTPIPRCHRYNRPMTPMLVHARRAAVTNAVSVRITVAAAIANNPFDESARENGMTIVAAAEMTAVTYEIASTTSVASLSAT